MRTASRRTSSAGLWQERFAEVHRQSLRLSSMTMDQVRKGRLLNRLTPLGVLRNLSSDQRDALASFVFDVSTVLRCTPDRKWVNAERRSAAQLRMLNRRAAKLRKAFAGLDAYWTRLGGGPSLASSQPEGNVHLVSDLDVLFDFTGRLDAIETAIDALALPSGVSEPIRGREPLRLDKPHVAVPLNQFFMLECRCSKTESEIRIAKLGNALWGWGFAVRERYEGEDKWRGCDAVRNLLKRSRAEPGHEQGTTSKKPARKK